MDRARLSKGLSPDTANNASMSDEETPEVGRNALELANEAIDFATELRTEAYRLSEGTTVIDFGHEVSGSLDAGLLLATLNRGGLIASEIRLGEIGPHPWPVLEATTSHPHLIWQLTACNTIGEWRVSGPGVAGYHDPFAVVVALGGEPVDDAGASAIAEEIDVPTEELYIVSSPPGSIAWTVEMATTTLVEAVDAVTDRDEVTISSVAFETPIAPTREEPALAREQVAACRDLGGRAHVRVEGHLDDADSIADESGPAVLTLVDERGSVQTSGATDLDGLGELLES